MAGQKIQKFAESMVACFKDAVANDECENNDYELLDFIKTNYRADCPEDVYDMATRIAYEIYCAKNKK